MEFIIDDTYYLKSGDYFYLKDNLLYVYNEGFLVSIAKRLVL